MRAFFVGLVLSAFAGLAVASGWVGEVADNGPYVFTVNPDGEVFGQWCAFDAGCSWIAAISTACVTGDEYPVLINADAGAAQMNVTCLGKIELNGRTYYRYGMNEFDATERIVRGSSVIGFAIAMQSGRFKVFRFSLAGANKTLDETAARARKALENRDRASSVRGEVL